MDATLGGSGAVAIVLDGKRCLLLGTERPEEVARISVAPGSTLKPFFLAAALRQGRIAADATVVCHRNLHIGHRDLACTHPNGIDTFNAEQALAYSCNTYFAALAGRWTSQETIRLLRSYGFSERPHLFEIESAGSLRQPESLQQQQLLVLGLSNVTASPAQLAVAYLLLGRKLDSLQPLKRGLEESVAYGMAHNAATPGFTIAGKTGTASDTGEAWTHGWFAGIVSRGTTEMVIVVYLPHGNGADAASLAQRFLRRLGNQTP